MTHRTSSLFPAKSGSRPRPTGGQVGFWLISTFCLLLVLRNAEAAVTYMGRG